MNKTEFVNAYATKTKQTKKASGEQVDAFLQTLTEGLVEKGKVAFMDNWSLEITSTNERKGHNPATGEEITIPAGKKVKFKASKNFKNEVLG